MKYIWYLYGYMLFTRGFSVNELIWGIGSMFHMDEFEHISYGYFDAMDTFGDLP